MRPVGSVRIEAIEGDAVKWQTVYFPVACLPGLFSVRGGERRRHRLAVAFTRIAQYHAQHPATACLAPKLLNRCSSAEKECRSVPTCCRAACVKSARSNHGARRRRAAPCWSSEHRRRSRKVFPG